MLPYVLFIAGAIGLAFVGYCVVRAGKCQGIDLEGLLPSRWDEAESRRRWREAEAEAAQRRAQLDQDEADASYRWQG